MELSGLQIAGIVIIIGMFIAIITYSMYKQYFSNYNYNLNSLQGMTVPSGFKGLKKFLEPSSEEPSSEEPSSEEPSSEEPSSEEPSSEEPDYSNPNKLLNKLYYYKKKNLNQFPKLSLKTDSRQKEKVLENKTMRKILNDLSNSASIPS